MRIIYYFKSLYVKLFYDYKKSINYYTDNLLILYMALVSNFPSYRVGVGVKDGTLTMFRPEDSKVICVIYLGWPGHKAWAAFSQNTRIEQKLIKEIVKQSLECYSYKYIEKELPYLSSKNLKPKKSNHLKLIKTEKEKQND